METMTLIILLTSLLVSWSAAFDLTILHTNDVHDRFEQFEPRNGAQCRAKDADQNRCFGGVSRSLTKIKEIRSKDANVLLLDAGDIYIGTTWFRTYEGEAASYFMNKLGYDAMALGNHEFDRGIKGLVPFLKKVKFPVVSSNIDISKEPRMEGLLNKSIVLTVGGKKIGLVGYTTPATAISSSPGNVTFSDEIPAIKAEVVKLQAAGINMIIALGHSGFSKDIEIAKSVEGIDVVVGGHTNTFLYTGKPPSNEKPYSAYPTVVTQGSGTKVYVVQDYTFGKYLGYLNTTWNNEGKITDVSGNPILLDGSVKQDEELEKDVQKWAEKVRKIDQKVVGFSLVYQEGSRDVCRAMECNLGNLIADAQVQKYVDRASNGTWTNVALALVNSGGIRSSIPKGKVTRGHVNSVQPFKNTVVMLEMKGKFIRAAFEHAVYDYNEVDKNGKFLQVSGFKVVYNLNQPNNQRVVSLDVVCTRCSVPSYAPIQDEEQYKFFTYDFIAKGGDGYTMFVNNRTSFLDYGDIDSDTTVDYITKFSPLANGLEGRIVHQTTVTRTTTPMSRRPLTTVSRATVSFSFSCVAIFTFMSSFYFFI